VGVAPATSGGEGGTRCGSTNRDHIGRRSHRKPCDRVVRASRNKSCAACSRSRLGAANVRSARCGRLGGMATHAIYHVGGDRGTMVWVAGGGGFAQFCFDIKFRLLSACRSVGSRALFSDGHGG